MNFKSVLILIIATFSACATPQKPNQKTLKIGEVPTWSKEAIWYQIFVERFRNGDPSNDPTPKDIAGAYPDFVPEGWKITDWGHDWYKDDDYIQSITEEQKAEHNGFETFGQKSQLRRYGGDLQGVFDKLDYLEELGITAIYFNPLNDAPSLHKYDARYWRHIDRNFGPTPEEDLKIIESEDPLDPSTWKMTGADKMFLRLIKELHKRDIKVILDYSWNHTGNTFWAWQDILKNQEKSAYKDWYWINSFDDPNTETDEFDYDGWLNVKSLPELKETQAQNHKKGISAFEGNISSQQAKDLIFNITKRWLDPNNDGNTDDGVDGFRLDVAAEVPLGFWREYREVVKSVNPEAYLIGEVWWEDYPDKLLDPKPFLEGDVFDAVMNYRWYRSARQFFNASPNKLEASEFVQQLESQRENLNPENNYAMMNLVSGHDSPRVLTSLFNKNKYKYQAKPDDNKNYKIHKPDAETYQTLKLLLAQQYTYIGAPHIWAGDEMGMWGADDPSCRKPLLWKDIEFEDEIAHPLNLERPRDKVAFDDELFNYYKKLIQIRKDQPVLSHGEIEFLVVNDQKDLIAYSRHDDQTEVISVFNNSNQPQTIRIPVITSSENYQDALSNKIYQVKDLYIEVSLAPRTAMILIPQA
ncbi:glycoside hydrolase family 13 protein [Weeksellaceae bacterium KMM 9724]|uniref:glycoside hydrolase family 13 protein n=1 Tax=Profundicola chukchiensis TaxID=2961959 RepID=UPI0024378E31|nr:glycoside hydrolase family 13 protein [Profundicola chukchiensis]MDG4949946.1 glycoside hydrolase family 13 protein [Profundicola chukchiensis]